MHLDCCGDETMRAMRSQWRCQSGGWDCGGSGGGRDETGGGGGGGDDGGGVVVDGGGGHCQNAAVCWCFGR